jgi:hypothetical protein
MGNGYTKGEFCPAPSRITKKAACFGGEKAEPRFYDCIRFPKCFLFYQKIENTMVHDVEATSDIPNALHLFVNPILTLQEPGILEYFMR